MVNNPRVRNSKIDIFVSRVDQSVSPSCHPLTIVWKYQIYWPRTSKSFTCLLFLKRHDQFFTKNEFLPITDLADSLEDLGVQNSHRIVCLKLISNTKMLPEPEAKMATSFAIF